MVTSLFLCDHLQHKYYPREPWAQITVVVVSSLRKMFVFLFCFFSAEFQKLSRWSPRLRFQLTRRCWRSFRLSLKMRTVRRFHRSGTSLDEVSKMETFKQGLQYLLSYCSNEGHTVHSLIVSLMKIITINIKVSSFFFIYLKWEINKRFLNFWNIFNTFQFQDTMWMYANY